MLVHTLDYGLHAAQIRVPAATSNVVGVANRVSVQWFLTAKFTCECHGSVAPCKNFPKDSTFYATRDFAGGEAILASKDCVIRGHPACQVKRAELRRWPTRYSRNFSASG